MRQQLHLSLIATALCLVSTNCNSVRPTGAANSPDAGAAPVDPPPSECNQERLTELYSHYVEPFVSGVVPSSCSQCHMTGIDISIYAQDNACDTMACMVDMGVVDLDQPSESEILDQILLGDPNSSVFNIASEHAAIAEWIEWSALCHNSVCGEIDSACEQGTGAPTTGIIPTGSCNETELLSQFWDAIVVNQGRCISCHSQLGEGVGSNFRCQETSDCVGEEECLAGRCRVPGRFVAPPFLEGLHQASNWEDPEHRRIASNTMFTLLTLDLIDRDEPLNSKLLTKPLPEGFQPTAVYGALEAVPTVTEGVGMGEHHGGDGKFVFACPNGQSCAIDCREEQSCQQGDDCGEDMHCNGGYCRLVDSVCEGTYISYLKFIQAYVQCR